jgi:hypothetical protein
MHDGVKLGRSLVQWCSFGKGEHMRIAALYICDGDESFRCYRGQQEKEKDGEK